jgi:exonuclease III
MPGKSLLWHSMPRVCKIGTININGITAASRLQMLEGFIRCHDFDVRMLQEVKTTHIEDFTNYITHVNMGMKDVELQF